MSETNSSPRFAKPTNSLTLTDQEFQRVARKVDATTGIQLPAHKRQLVTSRLSKRVQELSFKTFEAYLDYLDGTNGQKEITQFCNAITTNLTSYFREPHHFEHLTADLANHPNDKPLRVWSAGCSSGAEPYSIALSIFCRTKDGIQSSTRILATDIDTSVLSKAKTGKIEARDYECIPADIRQKYTVKKSDGYFEISDQIKRCIVFNHLNLLGDWPISIKFDYIFCRNVMIYFDKETQNSLVNRLVDKLKPNGFVYFGHSETALGRHPKLRCEGQTIYRKIG